VNSKKISRVFGLHSFILYNIIHVEKPIPGRLSFHHHLAPYVGLGMGDERMEGEEDEEEDGEEGAKQGCPEAGCCVGVHDETRSPSPGVEEGGDLVEKDR
jgi:hypothetical protein